MGSRIFKDTIPSSHRLGQLTDFEFRLWVGLMLHVDDYGCGDARPSVVRSIAFPAREGISVGRIRKAMERLAELDCIRLYEAEGQAYFWFPTFLDHQRLRTHTPLRPQPAELKDIVERKLREKLERDTERERKAMRGKPVHKPLYEYDPEYEGFERLEEALSGGEDVPSGKEEPPAAPTAEPSGVQGEYERDLARYGSAVAAMTPRERVDMMQYCLDHGLEINPDLLRWARDMETGG